MHIQSAGAIDVGKTGQLNDHRQSPALTLVYNLPVSCCIVPADEVAFNPDNKAIGALGVV